MKKAKSQAAATFSIDSNKKNKNGQQHHKFESLDDPCVSMIQDSGVGSLRICLARKLPFPSLLRSSSSKVRLHEEHERCLLYLDASTRKPLIATAERQLLECHISAILDKGFMMLMDGKRIEDLIHSSLR